MAVQKRDLRLLTYEIWEFWAVPQKNGWLRRSTDVGYLHDESPT
jgi:hypothetical protein